MILKGAFGSSHDGLKRKELKKLDHCKWHSLSRQSFDFGIHAHQWPNWSAENFGNHNLQITCTTCAVTGWFSWELQSTVNDEVMVGQQRVLYSKKTGKEVIQTILIFETAYASLVTWFRSRPVKPKAVLEVTELLCCLILSYPG